MVLQYLVGKKSDGKSSTETLQQVYYSHFFKTIANCIQIWLQFYNYCLVVVLQIFVFRRHFVLSG